MSKNLVELLKEECNSRFDKQYFEDVFLSDYPGCLPDNRTGDDIMSEILNKMNVYITPIIKELESQQSVTLNTVIEPSYNDHTRILIYNCLTLQVIYLVDIKSWHLNNMTPEQLGEELGYIYEECLSKIQSGKAVLKLLKNVG